MVSLARFLVAAASTFFGLPMAFASDSFTTEQPTSLCFGVSVSRPYVTSNFTRTEKGPRNESLFQGGFPSQSGRNPTVSVVFGPSFHDDTIWAKIHSAVDSQNISITYTQMDKFKKVQPYIAYYTVNPKEFCAVSGSSVWTEILAVSTFRETV